MGEGRLNGGTLMKLKTFYSRFDQGDVNWGERIERAVDDKVNDWLGKNAGIKLVEMRCQCTSQDNVYVVQIFVLYEEPG